MLTIFSRRELLTTFSMAEQNRVRDILSQNGIDYRIKVINPTARAAFGVSVRARTGSLGIDHEAACQYTIYVRKKDYQRACTLI